MKLKTANGKFLRSRFGTPTTGETGRPPRVVRGAVTFRRVGNGLEVRISSNGVTAGARVRASVSTRHGAVWVPTDSWKWIAAGTSDVAVWQVGPDGKPGEPEIWKNQGAASTIIEPTLTTTGNIGATVTSTALVIPGGNSYTSRMQTRVVGSGVWIDAGPIWTKVPIEAEGLEARSVWTGFDISINGTRTYYTPVFTVQDIPETEVTPFTATDVTIVRSQYWPAGQTKTFRPILKFPGVPTGTTPEIRFRVDPLDSGGTLWHKVEKLAGSADNEWVLAVSRDPAYPDFAIELFEDNSRRTGRLRFSHRYSVDQDFSDESVTFNVPLPPTTSTRPAATTTVSSITALKAAMIAANPGDIIDLASGIYTGKITMSSSGYVSKAAPGITVRGADPLNPPTWQNEAMTTSSSRAYALKGVTFQDLIFKSTTKDEFGYPTGTCMDLRYCERVTFEDCEVRGYSFQIVLNGCKTVKIRWNNFTEVAIDGLRFFSMSEDIEINNNRFWNPLIDIRRSDQPFQSNNVVNLAGQTVFVDDETKRGRHPDWIQFSRPPGEASGMVNVRIYENEIETGPFYMHGILFFNEATSRSPFYSAEEKGHKDITIARNYLNTGHVHAIALSGMTGLLCENNFIKQFRPVDYDPSNQKPGISLYPEVHGVIKSNVKPKWTDGNYMQDNFWRNFAASGAYDNTKFVTVTGEVDYPDPANPPARTKPKCGRRGYV